jgi:hypothetical protein
MSVETTLLKDLVALVKNNKADGCYDSIRVQYRKKQSDETEANYISEVIDLTDMVSITVRRSEE